ncbi:MAG: hypothetical protein EU544_00745 [Promethearchaeota archaeon]|nr:MAG: hypothetical protein EU544_00745 [Candidatus Lokiarchaeota archaeon]
MEKLIKKQDVNNFLSEIKQTFPNFVAGILCDNHGFPIASKVPKNFHIKENQLALSAIAKNRDFIQDKNFMKVKRSIDKYKKVKLFLLLEKTHKYVSRFKALKELIENQSIF